MSAPVHRPGWRRRSWAILGGAAWLLTGCARLEYPEIGLHEPIVKGGQTEINAGHVVDVALPGIWLAGHRTEAGGVFRNLPNARVGDVVCINYAVGTDTCWHVFEIRVVPHTTWIDHELAPLVLQTSWPGDRDLLVLAR